MGGIVAFKWGKQEMTLLQNRDNWEARVITAAAWDKDNKILGGRCALNDGTWFGVSKSGQVAFLVDPGLLHDGHGINDVSQGGAETLPICFLQSQSSWTPKKFAQKIKKDEKGNYVSDGEGGYEVDADARGLIYNLIVADITSSSMFHICKPDACKPRVDIKEVPFGVHTLSEHGLDAEVAKDAHLRRLFDEQIGAYENKELSLALLAERVMFDRVKAVEGDEMSALFVEMMDYPPVPAEGEEHKRQRYGTTSTTALAVIPTKEVVIPTKEEVIPTKEEDIPTKEVIFINFYEKRFKQAPDTISFNIDA